jgi:hypothetical protein
MNDHAVQDVKILQKVNAVHREAFKEKFPGQVEHCMRLTAERLQAVLTKRADTDPARPDTWAAGAKEIADLAIALNYLHDIQRNL